MSRATDQQRAKFLINNFEHVIFNTALWVAMLTLLIVGIFTFTLKYVEFAGGLFVLHIIQVVLINKWAQEEE